jgi:hypothetical protein
MEINKENAQKLMDNLNKVIYSKKKVIGYQVYDKQTAHLHPDMDASFCIYSKPQAEEMLKESKRWVDSKFELIPIYEGDIEDPTFMFEGDPETATEFEPNKVVEKIYDDAMKNYGETLNNLNDEDSETVFLNAVKKLDEALDNIENSFDQVDGNKYDVGEDISNMRFYFNNILIKLDKKRNL